MCKRELLFGFGAGMLVAAAALGLVRPDEKTSAAAALSREEIRAAAEGLEMVVLSREEYEQLKQGEKVDAEQVPDPPRKPVEPTVQEAESPRAGTAESPEVSAPDPATPASAPETPPAAVPSAALQPASAQPPSQPSAVIRKKISIPYKATAEGVARMLVAEGILPADNKLVDILRAQNKLHRIRVGTYEFSVPASEEEIVRIITTPPQH